MLGRLRCGPGKQRCSCGTDFVLHGQLIIFDHRRREQTSVRWLVAARWFRFTTNPTLMRKAGVTDYEAAARDIVKAIPDRSISFEVFADDFAEMERQARRITTWGKHVSVKIPITNTKKESALVLVRKLSQEGIALNVTALFTLEQVQGVVDAVKGGAPCFVSVFAGRIADRSEERRVGKECRSRWSPY